MEYTTVAYIIGLIGSVILHELGHAYVATWLGDPTARLEGRLSANPLVHIDPLMSVILPALLVMTGSPILFGAAKPVPYNPYNFTNQKWGEALVAFAGPAVNILLAIIFAGIARVALSLNFSTEFLGLMTMMVVLNLFLAFFNLIPLPPLDGSKILPRLLPFSLRMKYNQFRMMLEQNLSLAFLIVILVSMYVLSGPLNLLTMTTANLLIP